ncbi:GNAT family N-acetyltransferase [Vibrio sp. T187]|uniref:GNAT family N-acetyltransferase n=1 Tax=Vibrio TaxID=662 RepID=UPI0010C9CF5E|nr:MULTISPECIES: GNAT family N-acetyltransferase [Vibrio]MBW3696010.1 GNAT family N-acetyltransferase [Vibrio sp. T187]
MDVSIRKLEQADMAAVSAIYQCREVAENTSQLPYLSSSEINQIFSQPDFYNLVAELDGQVVGQVTVFLTNKPRAKHSAAFGIAVHPDFHGRGVGKSLIDATIEQCDNWLNIVRLELEVHGDNKVAISAYQKAGFELEGEKRMAVFKNGRYESLLVMARINPSYL